MRVWTSRSACERQDLPAWSPGQFQIGIRRHQSQQSNCNHGDAYDPGTSGKSHQSSSTSSNALHHFLHSSNDTSNALQGETQISRSACGIPLQQVMPPSEQEEADQQMLLREWGSLWKCPWPTDDSWTGAAHNSPFLSGLPLVNQVGWRHPSQDQLESTPWLQQWHYEQHQRFQPQRLEQERSLPETVPQECVQQEQLQHERLKQEKEQWHLWRAWRSASGVGVGGGGGAGAVSAPHNLTTTTTTTSFVGGVGEVNGLPLTPLENVGSPYYFDDAGGSGHGVGGCREDEHEHQHFVGSSNQPHRKQQASSNSGDCVLFANRNNRDFGAENSGIGQLSQLSDISAADIAAAVAAAVVDDDDDAVFGPSGQDCMLNGQVGGGAGGDGGGAEDSVIHVTDHSTQNSADRQDTNSDIASDAASKKSGSSRGLRFSSLSAVLGHARKAETPRKASKVRVIEDADESGSDDEEEVWVFARSAAASSASSSSSACACKAPVGSGAGAGEGRIAATTLASLSSSGPPAAPIFERERSTASNDRSKTAPFQRNGGGIRGLPPPPPKQDSTGGTSGPRFGRTLLVGYAVAPERSGREESPEVVVLDEADGDAGGTGGAWPSLKEPMVARAAKKHNKPAFAKLGLFRGSSSRKRHISLLDSVDEGTFEELAAATGEGVADADADAVIHVGRGGSSSSRDWNASASANITALQGMTHEAAAEAAAAPAAAACGTDHEDEEEDDEEQLVECFCSSCGMLRSLPFRPSGPRPFVCDDVGLQCAVPDFPISSEDEEEDEDEEKLEEDEDEDEEGQGHHPLFDVVCTTCGVHRQLPFAVDGANFDCSSVGLQCCTSPSPPCPPHDLLQPIWEESGFDDDEAACQDDDHHDQQDHQPSRDQQEDVHDEDNWHAPNESDNFELNDGQKENRGGGGGGGGGGRGAAGAGGPVLYDEASTDLNNDASKGLHVGRQDMDSNRTLTHEFIEEATEEYADVAAASAQEAFCYSCGSLREFPSLPRSKEDMKASEPPLPFHCSDLGIACNLAAVDLDSHIHIAGVGSANTEVEVISTDDRQQLLSQGAGGICGITAKTAHDEKAVLLVDEAELFSAHDDQDAEGGRGSGAALSDSEVLGSVGSTLRPEETSAQETDFDPAPAHATRLNYGTHNHKVEVVLEKEDKDHDKEVDDEDKEEDSDGDEEGEEECDQDHDQEEEEEADQDDDEEIPDGEMEELFAVVCATCGAVRALPFNGGTSFVCQDVGLACTEEGTNIGQCSNCSNEDLEGLSGQRILLPMPSPISVFASMGGSAGGSGSGSGSSCSHSSSLQVLLEALRLSEREISRTELLWKVLIYNLTAADTDLLFKEYDFQPPSPDELSKLSSSSLLHKRQTTMKTRQAMKAALKSKNKKGPVKRYLNNELVVVGKKEKYLKEEKESAEDRAKTSVELYVVGIGRGGRHAVKIAREEKKKGPRSHK